MLEHGGRLQQAAKDFNIPRERWLDLSTGLAPWPMAFPHPPPQVWQRLPESEDGLSALAARYYGAKAALPVAGSQAAIQALPYMRPQSRVGILSPCYAEHAHNWQKAGHTVVFLSESTLKAHLACIDVLVVVNPNNPTGRFVCSDQLREWHQVLAVRGGWLVVDEAFMDATPQYSLASDSSQQGLIVLRSFGKFSGLAGIRLGFVLAERNLLRQLEHRLGPWAVSGPARWIGTACLTDNHAKAQRARLRIARQRLTQIFSECGWPVSEGCDFFQWIPTQQADAVYQHCAQQGILVRLFSDWQGIRIGLPKKEADWQRLKNTVQGIKPVEP